MTKKKTIIGFISAFRICVFALLTMITINANADYNTSYASDTGDDNDITEKCYIPKHKHPHFHKAHHHRRSHSHYTIYQEKCYDPDMATEDDDQCVHPELQIN